MWTKVFSCVNPKRKTLLLSTFLESTVIYSCFILRNRHFCFCVTCLKSNMNGTGRRWMKPRYQGWITGMTPSPPRITTRREPTERDEKITALRFKFRLDGRSLRDNPKSGFSVTNYWNYDKLDTFQTQTIKMIKTLFKSKNCVYIF